MSLESQISALVNAANNLTSEVANKMKGIDQRVSQATASVPDTIRSLSVQSFFIDTELGDDETGDGSQSAPFKTIMRINGEVINGARTEVFLRDGQRYIIDGNGPRIGSGLLTILSWGETTSGRPIIQWKPGYNLEANTYNGWAFLLESGTILVRGCDIEVDFDSTQAAPLGANSSFFGYTNSNYAIVIYNSDIRLKNAPLLTANTGYSGRDVMIGESSIDVIENTNGRAKLLWNRAEAYHSFRLDVLSILLKNGLTWSDLIDYHADQRNILTSLDLA